MTEVIRYQNDMNRLNFNGFTKYDMDVFMAICSKTKEKGTDKIVIPFNELKELTHYERRQSLENFVKDIRRMNSRLMKVNCEIIYPNGIIDQFVLFPTFRTDEKTETLTVSVNKDFLWLLNEMRTYTTFELEKFVSLDSIYSKNLYRLLKQFRTTGLMKIVDIDEFRQKLDCPKSYSMKRFNYEILRPTVESLKAHFRDLEFIPEYANKRGRPLVGYTFTFVPEARREVPERKTTVKESQKKTTQTRTGNRFNDNFEQRNYSHEEMSEMERKLLNLAYKSVGDTNK